MIINAPSPRVKLKLLAEFRGCIDAATSREFVCIGFPPLISGGPSSSSAGKEHTTTTSYSKPPTIKLLPFSIVTPKRTPPSRLWRPWRSANTWAFA